MIPEHRGFGFSSVNHNSTNNMRDSVVFVTSVWTFKDICILCRLFQPGCEYTVQLKSGDVNIHIERSMPRVRRIQVSFSSVQFSDI